ncbi:MAG: hypothetical protein ACTHKC_02460 [Candidatus Nitrosocosmicus sp.]
MSIENKRFSNRKYNKQDASGDGPIKLDVKNRFLMLLMYYRLYMLYTS